MITYYCIFHLCVHDEYSMFAGHQTSPLPTEYIRDFFTRPKSINQSINRPNHLTNNALPNRSIKH